MTFSLITSGTFNLGDYGGTTAALDTTGADLIVVTYVGGSTDSITITDNKGNGAASAAALNASGFWRNWLAFWKNPTVGSGHTFSCTSGVYIRLAVMAFSGSDLTAPLDQTNSANNVGSAGSPGSVTPGSNNQLVVAGINYTGSSSNATVNSGFSGITLVAGPDDVGLSYLVQTTASAVNPTWSWGDNQGWAATIATFKAAAASGLALQGITRAAARAGGGLGAAVSGSGGRLLVGWRPSALTSASAPARGVPRLASRGAGASTAASALTGRSPASARAVAPVALAAPVQAVSRHSVRGAGAPSGAAAISGRLRAAIRGMGLYGASVPLVALLGRGGASFQGRAGYSAVIGAAGRLSISIAAGGDPLPPYAITQNVLRPIGGVLPPRAPEDVLDYAAGLAPDSLGATVLSAAVLGVPSGLAVADVRASDTGGEIFFRASGGEAGTAYSLTITVTLSSGQTVERRLSLYTGAPALNYGVQ